MDWNEFWKQVGPYLALFVIAIIVSGTAFVKSWFSQRAKLADLQVRVAEIDIDDTQRKNKLEHDAQEMIQRAFAQFMADRQRWDDELRHHRNLIDTANSENAKLATDNLNLKIQQTANVDKIALLTSQVESLTLANADRNKLEQQVVELTQQVRDMQARAEERHKQMSVITGENAELYLRVQQAERLLKECREQLGVPIANNTVQPVEKESTNDPGIPT